MAKPEGFTQILEFRPGMRRLIEDAIESLILLLDEIDGDDELEEGEDLEDGHDAEPYDYVRHGGAPLPDGNGAPIMTSS
jgi:hypothetical protein